jgi:hypothetical protein
MRDMIEPGTISRRKLLALFGFAGLAGASVIMGSDAEAQTVGMERRQGRRTGRHVRRQVRRTARTVRRQDRRM